MSKTIQPAPAAGRRFHRARTRLAGLRATVRRWPVWWPAAACALTGALAGTGYGLLAAPQYSATAYVVVVPADRADPATALGFAQVYGRVATSGGVLAQAQPDAGVPVATLRARVESATSPDAPMIEISGTAGGARQAAGFANAVAKALTEDGNKATKSTGVSLVLFAKALPPASPVSPSAPLSAAVGGCAGGLLGALLLLVRPRPDRHREAVAVPAPTAPVPSWASHNGTAAGATTEPTAATGPTAAEVPAGDRRPEEARDRKRTARTEATAGRKRESGPQERERVR